MEDTATDFTITLDRQSILTSAGHHYNNK